MNNEVGFVDLRLNRGDQQGNESFWPSFTDVMTVIVMIFLISMVVVLLRNMELVKQVRATLEAQQAAMELARATGEEKEDLASQLHQIEDQAHSAEDRAAQLQLEVMRLREQNQLRGKVISERNRDLANLMEERNNLTQQAAQLLLERQRLEESADQTRNQLNISHQELADLQQRLSTLQTHFLEKEQQLADIGITLGQQNESLTSARVDRQQAEQKYLVLADEFDNLKVSYDKLVRPARSSKGRYLVEVRYVKREGNHLVSWRQGGLGDFKPISSMQLDDKLGELKQQKPDGLYVKIILPESSGLSYSEAWKFTSHLHKNYDYYFQEASTNTKP
jgi:hypothetical protein